MAKCMKKGRAFRLLTDDGELAQRLADGDVTLDLISNLFFGAGGTVAVGVLMKSTVTAPLLVSAFANPEPVTKTLSVVVLGILGIIGAGFVAAIIVALKSGKGSFKHRFGGEYKGVRFEHEVQYKPV